MGGGRRAAVVAVSRRLKAAASPCDPLDLLALIGTIPPIMGRSSDRPGGNAGCLGGSNSRPAENGTEGINREDKMKKSLFLGSVAAVTLSAGVGMADTLADVKARGELICGVNTGLVGFAAPDANGNWAGFDIAVCKAVAASSAAPGDGGGGGGSTGTSISRQSISPGCSSGTTSVSRSGDRVNATGREPGNTRCSVTSNAASALSPCFAFASAAPALSSHSCLACSRRCHAAKSAGMMTATPRLTSFNAPATPSGLASVSGTCPEMLHSVLLLLVAAGAAAKEIVVIFPDRGPGYPKGTITISAGVPATITTNLQNLDARYNNFTGAGSPHIPRRSQTLLVHMNETDNHLALILAQALYRLSSASSARSCATSRSCSCHRAARP